MSYAFNAFSFFVFVEANEGAKLPHKKRIQAADLLVEEKADVVLAMDVVEGPFHILNDNLIRMCCLSKSVAIQEAIRLLIRLDGTVK